MPFTSAGLSHIQAVNFPAWQDSQDFQPFLPVSCITARISCFFKILVAQVEFFKTFCKADIIACNFTIKQSTHHEIEKIFLTNTNTVLSLFLSAFFLEGKLVYMSSANHGQASLQKACKL